MAIRERSLGSITVTMGSKQRLELPKDAVYHLIQLSIFGGTWVSVQGAMGTGPVFESCFPFSIISDMRLIRNGSDVVWQGSGSQLAKEHFYLNNQPPFARLYTYASNAETLNTVSSRGVTIPANSEGINANPGGFKVADAAGSSATQYFDMQLEIYLQLGGIDSWFGTLLDARELSSLVLEVTFATTAQCAIPGTANTSDTVTATLNVLSIDQDNVDYKIPFGTFKRSADQISNFTYNSSNNQKLLPKGNFWKGIIFQTRAYKSASTSISAPENAVLGSVVNRLNTNFYLRQTTLQQLQAKNLSDNGGRSQPWAGAQGHPQGWAYLDYSSAMGSKSELIPTYATDVFDLQLAVNAIGSAQNGATTAATNPIIDMLYHEVIPGVDTAENAPRAAQAGSRSRTSVRPYG